MKYKNKHPLLGIEEKNIQTFVEKNNTERVKSNNGYFGHMLNNWSISDQFHPLFTQNQSVMHIDMHTLTVCVH